MKIVFGRERHVVLNIFFSSFSSLSSSFPEEIESIPVREAWLMSP